jgi:hypothetical protein
MVFTCLRTRRGSVHRAAGLAVTVTALAVPATAAGQAIPEVDVQHVESSGEAANSCTGEVAVVSGQTTLVTREVVDGVGGLHAASIGTSVLLSDESVVVNHQADPGPTNLNANGAWNGTDVIQIMTISRGSEDNAFEHINHTDTFTPAGDHTSEALNVRQECQG